MVEQFLICNGLNGATGEYDLPPMTGEDLAQLVRRTDPPENLAELRWRAQQRVQRYLGVREGVDPKKLAEAGWGVIFAHDADPAIKEALSPLLDLRRQQAGELFRIYEGSDGHRPGETKPKFLARHGVGPGPADPAKMPYYLLIVGSPERIPYMFQFQLDVQYAIGRIHFDTVQEYANYVQGVVAAEKGEVTRPRKAAFFAVSNPQDPATRMSTDKLMLPVHASLSAEEPGWQIDLFARYQATKAQLHQLLGGEATPALLFTASHGMAFPKDHPVQRAHQGALLCQDWPGPEAWRQPIPHGHYFAGEDLESNTDLQGLIAFFFACFGAGTPELDEFSKIAFTTRQPIAPRPFVADLPTRMLGYSRSALAVIGHVERAWSYSFDWPDAGKQTVVFESAIQRLLGGHPVGSAFEYFNERYAELSADLTIELEEIEYGKMVDPYELSGMWTANNDARGYVILGDPAVRLPVSAG